MPRLKSKQPERKYRKRAHGTGTVTKLSGTRRKPFVAKLSCTKDVITGDVKQATLGTYATYEEASRALDLYYLYEQKEVSKRDLKKAYPELYNSIDKIEKPNSLTLKEIYQILREEKFQYQASVKGRDSWFNRLAPFHNRKIDSIQFLEMQALFDGLKSTSSASTLAQIKSILRYIYAYAVRYNYIDRKDNYIDDLDTSIPKWAGTKTKKDKNPFTEEEIKELFRRDTFEAKTILLFIYTGCRPNELLYLDRKDIHLNVETNYRGQKQKIDYLITGSKTTAGLNRFVPIHPRIKPIIVWFLENYDYRTLFMPDNIEKDWVRYYRKEIFNKEASLFKDAHVPYDCRHTFITLAQEYDMDHMAKKRIVGHKMNDITYDTYTHTVKNKLYSEVCKIPSL